MRVLTARYKDDRKPMGEFAPRHLPPPNLLKDDSSRMIIKIFTGDYVRGFVSAHLRLCTPFRLLDYLWPQDKTPAPTLMTQKNMQLLCALWGVRKSIV